VVNNVITTKKQKIWLEQIVDYVSKSSGLVIKQQSPETVELQQKVDGKFVIISSTNIANVIDRVDHNQTPFLQINFNNGTKILITESLVGFKPAQKIGLDMDKLPKVVTTPDLVSIFEAIEEALCDDTSIADSEVDVLKQVFEAVLAGGEDIGFDLGTEKNWIKFLTKNNSVASA
jgi:hypothetical protein